MKLDIQSSVLTVPSCRFCATPLEHSFVDLGSTPLCQKHLRADQLSRMEPFYPLHVRVCSACFLAQLDTVVPPEEIFADGEYAYYSSYSDSWLAHVASYCDRMVESLGLGREHLVVEIASNDGYLLQNFVERGVPCLGVEPAVNVAEVARSKGVETVTEFFGRRTAERIVAQRGQADLLIGNNVLAHVPDINDLVAGLKVLLARNGVLTMEFPHLMRLVEHNQFDTIYHEHYSYLSLGTACRIFAHHGLVVFDVEELSTHGGSLRIHARHAEAAGSGSPRLDRLLAEERARGMEDLGYYRGFGNRVRETKCNLLEFLIRAVREGKSIAGYGAPGKGNTLLNYCGIGPDFLEYTVDRSPHKQGGYLPGSRIPIRAPEEINRTRPDYLFILPWNLKDEIMEQMSGIREWMGRFVVAIPEVQVFS